MDNNRRNYCPACNHLKTLHGPCGCSVLGCLCERDEDINTTVTITARPVRCIYCGFLESDHGSTMRCLGGRTTCFQPIVETIDI